jgi:hypothetical protein
MIVVKHDQKLTSFDCDVTGRMSSKSPLKEHAPIRSGW